MKINLNFIFLLLHQIIMPIINNINDLPKEWFITSVYDKRLNNIPKYYYKDIKNIITYKPKYFDNLKDNDIIVYINNTYVPMKYVLDTDSIEILRDNFNFICLILNQTKEQQLFCCQNSYYTSSVFKYFNIPHDNNGKTLIDEELLYTFYKYHPGQFIDYKFVDISEYLQMYLVKMSPDNIKSIKFTDKTKIPKIDIFITALNKCTILNGSTIRTIEYIIDKIKTTNYINNKNIQFIIANQVPTFCSYIYRLDEDIQIMLLNKDIKYFSNINNPTEKVKKLYNELKENKIALGICLDYHCDIDKNTIDKINKINDSDINEIKNKRKLELIQQMNTLCDELKEIDI